MSTHIPANKISGSSAKGIGLAVLREMKATLRTPEEADNVFGTPKKLRTLELAYNTACHNLDVAGFAETEVAFAEIDSKAVSEANACNGRADKKLRQELRHMALDSLISTVEKAEAEQLPIDVVEAEGNQAIIITGNPVDGFSFIGPFPDGEKAHEYAGRHVKEDWHVANLDQPGGR